MYFIVEPPSPPPPVLSAVKLLFHSGARRISDLIYDPEQISAHVSYPSAPSTPPH